MNRKFAFIAFALLLATGFAVSCGDDDDDDPIVPGQIDNKPTEGALTGWTSATHVPPEGGRQFFVDFYSPNEAATVSVKKTGKNQLSLAYNSNTWGKATFESLEVQEANGRYILPTDAETTIVMERGAMGQQGGGGEYKLTLVEGSISTDLTGLKLVMSAFMNANHGSYELTFHEGDAPAPVVQ